ncbi:hypothetical protein Aperf_G00000122501 [Anoplocephala perfoliata]
MPAVFSAKNDDLETNNPEEFQKLKGQFKDAIKNKCKPLPDEPDFFTNDTILTEFLRARKYNLNAAVAMLTDAVEWRRGYHPLKVDCRYCHENPGFHSMRQIGFDKSGCPIVYSCFSQASATGLSSDDTVLHCVQVLENVRRSFKGAATQLIIVFDCTGMTLPCCNPYLGKQVMNVFSNYYPERLGKILVVNYMTIFQQVWYAVKQFLDPVTASKMTFIQPDKLKEELREICNESTADWLETEIQLNKNITEAQLRFWEKPSGGVHDPRGTDEYIKDYVECKAPPNGFEPHPNIVDIQKGTLEKGRRVELTSSTPEVSAEQMKKYGLSATADGDNDHE